MLFNKKCSRPMCQCKEFYMMWDGIHIELRCMDGHYQKNLSRKNEYPIMLQYEDVEDRTGLNDNKYESTSIVDLQAHNLESTANGYLLKEKERLEVKQQSKYGNKNKTYNYKQYKKTGTYDTTYNVSKNLKIY